MTVATNKPIDLLMPYQKRHVANPARFTWINWSRQTGKSFASTLRRILRGMQRRRNQIFLSAGERQSRELMMKAKQHLEAMQLAITLTEIEADDPLDGTKYKGLEITLPDPFGIRIIGLPANPATARGLTGDLLLDEFAMHKDDRGIWAAAFPSILRNEGEIDVCSTPKGRQNVFYRLRTNTRFHQSTLTIDDAIADGLDVDRDELFEAMGDEELFRQEFLCEFVDEATAFLTYDLIGECECPTLSTSLDVEALAERKKGDVVLGWDVARKRNLSVIWAFEVESTLLRSLGMIEVCDVPYHVQFETASNLLRAPCVRKLCVDSTGLGNQLAESLVLAFGEGRVEACNFSSAFKEQAAHAMRNRFTDKLIAIPVSEAIRNDLHSVRKTVTAAGNIRLDAPETDGSHADRFWACALACHAASENTGPWDMRVGDPFQGLDLI